MLPQADARNVRGMHSFLITFIPWMAGRQALPFYPHCGSLAAVAFENGLVHNARALIACAQSMVQKPAASVGSDKGRDADLGAKLEYG